MIEHLETDAPPKGLSHMYYVDYKKSHGQAGIMCRQFSRREADKSWWVRDIGPLRQFGWRTFAKQDKWQQLIIDGELVHDLYNACPITDLPLKYDNKRWARLPPFIEDNWWGMLRRRPIRVEQSWRGRFHLPRYRVWVRGELFLYEGRSWFLPKELNIIIELALRQIAREGLPPIVPTLGPLQTTE